MKKMLGLLVIIATSFCVVFTALAAEALTPAPGSTSEKPWPKQIYLGSYPKVSGSYPTFIALSQLITKYTPAQCIVREYPHSAPGIEALARGNIDLWATGQHDLAPAYYGESVWKGRPLDIALLAYYYPGTCSFAVRPGAGIDTIEQLRGKRVVCVGPSPLINVLSRSVLQYYGIWDTIKKVSYSSQGEISDAMVNGAADALFDVIGAGYQQELKRSGGLKWLSIDPKALEKAMQEAPGFVAVNVHPDSLKPFDMPADAKVTAIAYIQGICSRKDLPNHIVYGVLDALYGPGHIDEVKQLQPMFLSYPSLKLAASAAFLPFHPGAIEFYKDKGVWTKEHGERQQQLLERRKK